MKPSAIILRLEGVVAETGEVYRNALNAVLMEAGFDRVVSKRAFARNFGHIIIRERFFEFAEQNLHSGMASEDVRALYKASYKRLRTVATQALKSSRLAFGSGILELLETVRRRGLPCVLLSAQSEEVTETIILAMSGAPSHRLFDIIVSGEIETEAERATTLVRAADMPLLKHGSPLLLEACGSGLAAAEAAGVAAMAIIGDAELNGGLYGAKAVVDRLDDLLSGPEFVPDADRGEALLAAVSALMSSRKRTSSNRGEAGMQVFDILKDKGASIKSLAPGDTIQFLAKRLAEENVGAMVVISRDGVLEGIVSERDVAQGLASQGCELLSMPVSALMTRAVITCSPKDSLVAIAKVMTERRIRHLPVSEGGKLVGVISIGDVLSQRLEEVELEANALRDLALTRS